jgi:phage-related protein (TIGR01555 family)
LFKSTLAAIASKHKKEEPQRNSVWGADNYGASEITNPEMALTNLLTVNLREPPPQPRTANGQTMAMDSASYSTSIKNGGYFNSVSIPLMNWYAAQSFIGYQMCAILSQNWLINKACLVPAEDAVRNGFEITSNDGTEITPEMIADIAEGDRKFKLHKNLIEFVNMGRIFGIRIAKFIVDSPDPDYYEKPYNPDGVRPGSYRGISQIDPYWVTPLLDVSAASKPGAIDFYEPTWWMIEGKPVHRTHLVIFRNGEVPDILKPTYFYGGISTVQKIYERVYCAERTANEAPLLAMTKRTAILKVDTAKALQNQRQFDNQLQTLVNYRNNQQVYVIGLDDELTQIDTALADLDAIIATQYQIVAAACNVPVVKLMGTSPKGFNATGEYEESNYHEELESIQEHACTPLVLRHHELLVRSEIAPKYGVTPFKVEPKWLELDAMTAKEAAEVNKLKADTDAVLVSTGAIDGVDVRERIAADKDSGYNGLSTDPENIPEMNLGPQNEKTPDLVDEENSSNSPF